MHTASRWLSPLPLVHPPCCRPLTSLHPAPQVGEGSSFRRQERERYAAAGLRSMANLAHATEEELLAAAEVQVRRAPTIPCSGCWSESIAA